MALHQRYTSAPCWSNTCTHNLWLTRGGGLLIFLTRFSFILAACELRKFMKPSLSTGPLALASAEGRRAGGREGGRVRARDSDQRHTSIQLQVCMSPLHVPGPWVLTACVCNDRWYWTYLLREVLGGYHTLPEDMKSSAHHCLVHQPFIIFKLRQTLQWGGREGGRAGEKGSE